MAPAEAPRGRIVRISLVGVELWREGEQLSDEELGLRIAAGLRSLKRRDAGA